MRVILNGYDWDADTVTATVPLSEAFTISHLGVITPSRNNTALWQALQELKDEIDDFGEALKINLIGQIDQTVIDDLVRFRLDGNAQITPYVPHDQVLQTEQSSQILLLLVNNTPNAKGILTGKLFEYIATGRPILCIGPEDGDAARVINEANAGTTIGFDDKDKMKDALKSLYQKYLNHDLPNSPNADIDRYSRRSLAREYAKIINSLK